MDHHLNRNIGQLEVWNEARDANLKTKRGDLTKIVIFLRESRICGSN